MAGGKAENPNVIQLSILEGRKFVPRDHRLDECNIFNSEGSLPNFFNNDSGVSLTRTHYLLGEYSSNTVEICHHGHYELGIRFSQKDIASQTIIPFPNFFAIDGHKDDDYRNRWLALDYPNMGIHIRKIDRSNGLIISMNKPGSSCYLDIFSSSNHYNPRAIARLSFIPEEKAQKLITDEINYRKKMETFFKKKGWDRLS